MGIVVPSQIVRTILSMYPMVATGQNKIGLDPSQAPRLRGILDLVDGLPQTLLVVSPDEYAAFIMAVANIRFHLGIWIVRGSDGSIHHTGDRDSVAVIHEILSKCPDQYPPPAGVDLTFIAPGDLRDSLEHDISEIRLALENLEWKAATVLAGSTVEALLHWYLASETASTLASKIQASGLRNLSQNLDDWVLDQMLKVAKQSPAKLKTETVAAADLARNYRNLIHPGRTYRTAQKCDRGTAYSAVGAMESVISDLR